MAFFKKQRHRYQKWLNSFVAKHNDKWYMPLITMGLGISYVIFGILLLALLALLCFIVELLVKVTGFDYVLFVASAIYVIYMIGVIVRIPGDFEYDRQKNPRY